MVAINQNKERNHFLKCPIPHIDILTCMAPRKYGTESQPQPYLTGTAVNLPAPKHLAYLALAGLYTEAERK